MPAMGRILTSPVLLRASQALVRWRCHFGVAADPHGGHCVDSSGSRELSTVTEHDICGRNNEEVLRLESVFHLPQDFEVEVSAETLDVCVPHLADLAGRVQVWPIIRGRTVRPHACS